MTKNRIGKRLSKKVASFFLIKVLRFCIFSYETHHARVLYVASASLQLVPLRVGAKSKGVTTCKTVVAFLLH